MTQNLTRRDLFKRSALVLPAGIAVLLADACSQSEADQFITITGEIVAGVEGALPIIQLFIPPPYSALEPTVAALLNQVNTVATNIANAAATNGTALALTQVIIAQLQTIVFSPTVLASLPTNLIGPNGPINVQALFQSIFTLVNNELALAAHMSGAVITPNPANVINSVILSPTIAAKAKLATTPAIMTGKQMTKINAMLAQALRNAAVMSALPSAATVKANAALGR
jgi:hypothetical protein